MNHKCLFCMNTPETHKQLFHCFSDVVLCVENSLLKLNVRYNYIGDISVWSVQFVRMAGDILTSGSKVHSRSCRYKDS